MRNRVRKLLFRFLKRRPSLAQLRQIHAQVITQSLERHASLSSCLIRCYLTSNHRAYAMSLFDRYPSPPPPIILWNLLIKASSKVRHCSVPFGLFCRLVGAGGFGLIWPDEYTFTSVLASSARQTSSEYGEMVHGVVVKSGFGLDLSVGNSLLYFYSVFNKLADARNLFDQMAERDIFTWNSLLCGYAKNGYMGEAVEVFKRMPVKNDVSWTVMISGFVDDGRFVDAVKCFDGMLGDADVKPNEAVLVCALSACAHLGALDRGKHIHLYVQDSGIGETPNICTVLVDMYAKCGRIDCAETVFSKIHKPDVHNFTSMIMAYSLHGFGKDALNCFSKMLKEYVKPDEVTLLAVLSGCSHSGLVQEGSLIFHDMERLYGIKPRIVHHGCYVDLLGRAGYTEKAFEVAKNMPADPDIVIWRSLLNSCKTHRNVKLGEKILRHVSQLSCRGQDGGEVLLSNLYASFGKWEGVIKTREMMVRKRRSTSNPGCSWIEVNGGIHEFRVADQLHPQILIIREKLLEVLKRASLAGYVPNTTQVSFDLSEEDKLEAVTAHSEKLAVAFGIMTTSAGTSIRITKNLRSCEDCHSALKSISQVYNREIIVRDRSRFHTFKEGSCSCNDFW
uniref:DYW domain-containing protein n=1 Tax=Kalanchoe fedtschenkoi TaxID=63787 RepID=A0A7N0VEX2_KALFE